MIDKLIKEKADLVSYSQIELSNIAATLGSLKIIVNNEPDYQAPFLGGSYKRGTMVKRISDIDMYFRYTGTGTSQVALDKLKTHLINNYPSAPIKRDKPSILIEFNKIPINITPYKEEKVGILRIPDHDLIHWREINFGQLENSIIQLRQKNSKYIDLIKVLKLWNRNYNRGLKNFDIEKRVCGLFLEPMSVSNSLSDWLWTFFQNNGFSSDGKQIYSLMHLTSEPELRTAWLKFIENRA